MDQVSAVSGISNVKVKNHDQKDAIESINDMV